MFPAGHLVFGALAREQTLLAQARGDFPTASTALDRAWAIVGGGSWGDHAVYMVLVRRAELELETGHPAEAERAAHRAVALAKAETDTGTPSANVGAAYLALGRALRAQGEREPARAAFLAALEQLRSTLGSGHPDSAAAPAHR